MINPELFTAQSGDFSFIASKITLDDAIAFGGIYEDIKAHAELRKKPPDFQEPFTLMDYAQRGVCVALEGYALGSITTLKTAGLITTSDNVHIGLTALGYGFYDFIQE